MMEYPLVSIVTVCYNSRDQIEPTILSVKGQTYPNLQYIVIDGKSTDGTLEILERYRSDISNLISEPDEGLYFAMNKGLDMANGDWIGFLNAGDTYFAEDSIQQLISSADGDTRILFGKSISFYKDWTHLRFADFRLEEEDWYMRRMPNHQAVFLSKEIYPLQKFDTSFQIIADTKLLRKLFRQYKYKCCEIIVCRFELGGVSSFYPTLKKFNRVNEERSRLSGYSFKTFLGLFGKFILMKMLGRDLFLSFYIKRVLSRK